MERDSQKNIRPEAKSEGFTVTELVVVVASLTVLLAIAAPVMSSYLPSYHLKQAERNILSQMQLARIHAIKNRVRTVVVFSPTAFTPPGGGTFKIYVDRDSDWVEDAGEPLIVQSTTMPRGVTLTSAAFDFSGNGTDIRTYCGFGPGGLAARNGSVYVKGTGAGEGIVLQNSKNDTRTLWFWASGKTETQ